MPEYIDTHTHLYLEQFTEDRFRVVEAAAEAGVSRMLLPNVDAETIEPMLGLSGKFPELCLPMMGLHPTSVKPGFEIILAKMKDLLERQKYYAIGETGIDLYWDKTYLDLQIASFKTQIEWAMEFNLPVVIHSRDSVNEIASVLENYKNSGLKGVMHCFPGNVEQARWFVDFGFHLGIGGVVTYKRSLMAEVAKEIPAEYLLLETDAPYLPPVPFRGKRNEPSYLPLIAQKVAALKGISVSSVAEITTQNARNLFDLT